MQGLVSVALYGWLILTLGLFFVYPPRRALLYSVVGGMVILPSFAVLVPGLPKPLGRSAAVVLPCLLGSLSMSGRSWTRLRMVPTDLAVLALLLSPITSSMSNDLGFYDGLSHSYNHLLMFAIPYMLGRVHFGGADGPRAVVLAITIGALLLMPLALWEIRMSPNLHAMVYGAGAIRFYMFSRFSGFRPIAFFPSPLMLTFALSAGTLCAFWLSRSVRGSHFYGIRYAHWAILLGITTVLGKTLGAITLMIVCAGMMWTAAKTRRRWLLLLPIAFGLLYPPLRVSGLLPAESIMQVVEPIFPASNAETLSYRLTQEDLFAEHAMERPWFGWGGWGRNRTFKTASIDGLWIILFSTQGWFALGAYVLFFALPIFRVLRRIPVHRLEGPDTGPAAALAVVLFALWIDCLANAFLTPIFAIALGSIAAWKPSLAPPPKAGRSNGSAPETPAEKTEPRAEARFIDLARHGPGRS